MKVISCEISTLSRRKGREAIQMAAYCSRSKLYSEYTGLWYDGSKKKDLIYHEVMIPDYAPKSYLDSEVLWNEVEKIEKSKIARLARMARIVIPKEITDKDGLIKMAREYVEQQFVQRGMCADVSIHAGTNGDNPHIHIMLTTRSIGEDGQWLPKQKRNYLLDENGDRIKDPVTNKYRLGWSIKTNDWDDSKKVEMWRKAWADLCNERFRELGVEEEVTHKSYKRQGIAKEPTHHLGARAKALEDRGVETRIGKENREIQKRNLERGRIILHQRLKRSKDKALEFDRSL